MEYIDQILGDMEAKGKESFPVTPDWLTQVLRKNRSITGSKVTTISAQTIGAEFGFLDSLQRITLTYDEPEPSAPRSLVLKLSSSEARYQRIGHFYNAYEREFNFYNTVALNSPIRLPRCYGHEVDLRTNAHILILEDLGTLSSGDQVRGLTPDQAKASIETIGRFHALWWNSPALDSLSWMPRRNFQPSRFQAAWPSFRDLYRTRLSASSLALGDYLCVHLESLIDDIEKRPHTIVHSDFRADNLLFDLSTHPQPVVVLDWQLAIRSTGVLDVARLLCGSVSSQDRATFEMKFVEHWHAMLKAGGVQGYSSIQAVEDYKACALICLYYPVTIHEAEEAAGKRGTELAQAQITRFFRAAEELVHI